MVDGGVNEVRKTIKKATLGVGLDETPEEYVMGEEKYILQKDDEDDYFDEDEDDDDYWDGARNCPPEDCGGV